MHCSWTSHLLAGKIRTDLETCSSEERNRTGTKQHHHKYKPNTKQINKISQDPPQKKKTKPKDPTSHNVCFPQNSIPSSCINLLGEKLTRSLGGFPPSPLLGLLLNCCKAPTWALDNWPICHAAQSLSELQKYAWPGQSCATATPFCMCSESLLLKLSCGFKPLCAVLQKL